jgi:small ligand-binding sensory domain FIST
MLLADPFSTPMVQTLPAIAAAFPGVPLFGGMASGSRAPGGNRLLLDGKISRDGAIGVAFGGGLRIDCTVSQGCRPIGKPMVITKSKRHVVQELAGRRALDVLQEMAGGLSEEDRALVETKGLLVGRVINEYKPRFGRGDFLIRSLVDADQDAGYIVIGDPQTRVGQTIQFHVRDRRTAEEDFQLLLEAQKLHAGPAGALLFSCNGRGSRLFERPDADASMIHDALGDLPLAGFFAAGEIGPIGNENFVHGHTASLAVFRPG